MATNNARKKKFNYLKNKLTYKAAQLIPEILCQKPKHGSVKNEVFSGQSITILQLNVLRSLEVGYTKIWNNDILKNCEFQDRYFFSLLWQLWRLWQEGYLSIIEKTFFSIWNRKKSVWNGRIFLFEIELFFLISMKFRFVIQLSKFWKSMGFSERWLFLTVFSTVSNIKSTKRHRFHQD